MEAVEEFSDNIGTQPACLALGPPRAAMSSLTVLAGILARYIFRISIQASGES